MTASDLQTAVMLREDVVWRLEHREWGNTQGIGSPGDHRLSGRR
jgi:hypothetical protein